MFKGSIMWFKVAQERWLKSAEPFGGYSMITFWVQIILNLNICYIHFNFAKKIIGVVRCFRIYKFRICFSHTIAVFLFCSKHVRFQHEFPQLMVQLCRRQFVSHCGFTEKARAYRNSQSVDGLVYKLAQVC